MALQAALAAWLGQPLGSTTAGAPLALCLGATGYLRGRALGQSRRAAAGGTRPRASVFAATPSAERASKAPGARHAPWQRS
ncbi:MAG: hypothetical protein MZV65_32875 [Chromatiales bacterium]|nr:hypothetical protein [Chromatiales bacterium]